MGEFKDGTYDFDSEEAILEGMLDDAETYWDESFSDNQRTIFKQFYIPTAKLFSALEEDLQTVLHSTHIDKAEDEYLNQLTSLVGVTRKPAQKASGEAKFSRSNSASRDYTIPEGTVVQTDAVEPVKYETTETATLAEGTTSVTIPIEAVEGGADGNAAADRIVVMPSPPAGVESVTNPAEVDGGKDRENDDELRERTKEELSNGSRASARALISNVEAVTGVNSTSIFINDSNTDNTGSGGLPDHSFELVVSGGDSQEIAQTILDTKAAGDTSYAGAYGSTDSGTGKLPNGDSFTIEFSRPSNVKIYVDASLDVTDEFGGKDSVKDEIVEYIGGTRTTGHETSGELGVSDDVVYGEIEYAIRSVDGVYDVTDLYVDTSSSPSSTSNISIADHEIAVSDGTDSSITLSTTQV